MDANFMQAEGLKIFSMKDNQEGYFSWQPCDCCMSNLGGMRHDYDGITDDGIKLEYSICTDCVEDYELYSASRNI